MKIRTNWTKIDTIFTVALIACTAIPVILIGLTDTKTSIAIFELMVKIFKVTAIVAVVLVGIIFGWVSVECIKENKSDSKSNTANDNEN